MNQNLLSLKSIIKNILLTEAPIDVWKNKNQSLSSEQLSQAESYFADLTGKYNATLHPTAKDLTKLSFEQLETLYKAIEIAKNKNLKATYIQWLTKQLKQQNLNLQQVIEDYIPPLLSLQKNKEKFEPNFLQNLETIEQLNQTLNQKVSSDEMAVSEEQLGKLAEENGWILYMPHTTEASCEIGKTGGRRDTTWCTTRPDSSNLFLQYSASPNESIILFYVIKKGVNAEKDPFAKMSVGFVDGKPKFNQGDGGVSVNASNNNLTQKKFEEVLGKDLASKFLQIMKQKATSLKGEHPAKDEFRKLVQNPKAFQAKIDSFAKDENGQELRRNFIQSALNYKEISPEVLVALAKDKDKYVRLGVAENPNTPPEALIALAKDKYKYVRLNVAENPNTRPEALQKILVALAKDKDEDVRWKVVRNPNIPPEVLTVLAKDKDVDVRLEVAVNPNTPPEVLTALAIDKDVHIRYVVATNPNTPPEVLTALARDKDVRMKVAKNPNTPPEALTALAIDKDVHIRYVVATNPNTPPEALTALARDKDKDVRYVVATNPNTPPEALTALARDKDVRIRDTAAKTLEGLKNKQLAESIIIEKVWRKLSKLI